MNEHDESVVRGDLEHGHQSRIGDGIRVHSWKKTDAMQMRVGCRGLDPIEGVGLKRVEHEVAEEAVWVRRNGGGDTLLIAGGARDQAGAMDAVAIQFNGPAFRERRPIAGGNLPVEQRAEGFRVIGSPLTR